jgi:FkbM family methyltransferase
MLDLFIKSFQRKIARRFTKKYPTHVDSYQIEGIGEIKFANWENPLVAKRTFTKETIDFLKRFISEGDFAIDIGANIGHVTIQMSIITGKKGLNIGFDPNPYVYEVLVENINLNNTNTNVHAHNFAITETEEEFFYNSSEASFNNGGISINKENGHGKFSLATKVKGVNLEAFLKKEYPEFISKLKLIKIDTEGYDKEIIKSILNLLKQTKAAVITECFGKNNPEERFEQFELLKSLGYSLYYFSDFTSDAEIIPINVKEDMLKWKHFDLFAI